MIFPQLKGKRVGYLNLNLWVQQLLPQGALQGVGAKSPFLEAKHATLAVASYHSMMSLDWSYGDWMADRRFVWKGSYLEDEAKFLHLGIDLNVPPGTHVALDRDATVIRIDNDAPEKHGWGNRVIFALRDEPIVLIYAHLGPNIRCKVGEEILAGTVFGEIGSPKENGGWFPHLHVQAVVAWHYEELLKNDLRDLDGYGNAESVHMLSATFPDPMRYIRIW